MTLKHRGVKIVPVKIVRYEVRTIDGRKLKAFGSTSAARAWIDGYLKAVAELTPKATANGKAEPRRRRQKPADATAAAN